MGHQTKVAGVILAGGLARRMGNLDKGLVCWHHRPLVSYAIEAMGEVVGAHILISANRSIALYQQFGFPVVQDLTDSFDGPLAGVLAALHYTDAEILLVMPCDSPLIKAQHLQALLTACANPTAEGAVASDGQRLHPVFLALKSYLKESLSLYLSSGQRKLEDWINQHSLQRVDFSAQPTVFANINTLSELNSLSLPNCAYTPNDKF